MKCIQQLILTNEMTAANKRILTRRSSNCSSTSCHRDFPSSAGNSEKLLLILSVSFKILMYWYGTIYTQGYFICLYKTLYVPFRPYLATFFFTWSFDKPRSGVTLK